LALGLKKAQETKSQVKDQNLICFEQSVKNKSVFGGGVISTLSLLFKIYQ